MLFSWLNGVGLTRQGNLIGRELGLGSNHSTGWEALNKPLVLPKTNKDHTGPFEITGKNGNEIVLTLSKRQC